MIDELTRARVSFEDIRSMNHRKFPIKVKIAFLFTLLITSFIIRLRTFMQIFL